MTGEQRKIKVTISPLGKPTVEAIGFTGGSCSDATKAIEQALAGTNAGEKVIKPEFYQAEQEGTAATQSW